MNSVKTISSRLLEVRMIRHLLKQISIIKPVFLILIPLILIVSNSSCSIRQKAINTESTALLPITLPITTDPEFRVRTIPINDQQGDALIDKQVYESLTLENCRIEINIAEQKARVFAGPDLAIETPISSGKLGNETPLGNYKILEKKEYHESSVYGSWIDKESGQEVLARVNSRDTPAPSNTKWKGVAMPYWQRLTWDGIGMHVGQLPGYPASSGCLRFPEAVLPYIYSKTRLGTPVVIR